MLLIAPFVLHTFPLGLTSSTPRLRIVAEGCVRATSGRNNSERLVHLALNAEPHPDDVWVNFSNGFKASLAPPVAPVTSKHQYQVPSYLPGW